LTAAAVFAVSDCPAMLHLLFAVTLASSNAKLKSKSMPFWLNVECQPTPESASGPPRLSPLLLSSVAQAPRRKIARSG